MEIINNSSSVIIVLHEIYGINQHIQKVCEKFSIKGYDVICPNLINVNKPFNYNFQEEAYKYFTKSIGFDSAVCQVKQLLMEAKQQYKHVYLLGYSIGATIAWLCSSEKNICDGIIGYYGSRIRDYIDITPKCPVLLIFPKKEKSFNVQELVIALKKLNIDIYMLSGKHGFSDPFCENYNEKSFQEAEILVDNFLEKINFIF
ncbi:DeoR faimly transcriptional regulator [Clostridium carboxidivorans P7]|uniref:Dienelactone hydrolase n=1 Tax=Clostridium carboxidivorans P7 TaxID=536227 RepID=C6PMJ9_9CLOT|nr:dienelactone hydrolase family protein [Clostridium carboxidivorans]AKN29847.1 DeoR faimly transcriptional regulator [Clostridium carboxidivorans P7]EET89491.1 dienelactone hydrolase [Clostridium carboxidivorans P7]